MRDFQHESLSHDPIHGYIPFTSSVSAINSEALSDEATEQQIIDHPWLQRLRQIHQLQTAWWVFPTAEHTRFQHVLGAMYLASRAVETLFDSLKEVCPGRAQPGLRRIAHAPGCASARRGPRAVRTFFRRAFSGRLRPDARNPGRRNHPPRLCRFDPPRSPQSQHRSGRRRNARSRANRLSHYPAQKTPADEGPKWLRFLRSLFSGLYTVDNMDFVLRDAYMSGYSTKAFDLDRLLHYSMFTEKGLTIHERGLSALVRFISIRAELFRAIYFHRTVRAIDLGLQELFLDSKPYLFPGNPLEHLDEYQQLTEWSLLMQVSAWPKSNDPKLRDLGLRWRDFLGRHLRWKMACEQTIFFAPGESEQSSVFSSEKSFEAAVRGTLPKDLKDLPIRVDTARHVHRPGAHTPGGRAEFPLRSGQPPHPQPGRPRTVPPHRHQLPHLPHLRIGQPAQRRTRRRHGPPDLRRHRRCDKYVSLDPALVRGEKIKTACSFAKNKKRLRYQLISRRFIPCNSR